MEVYNPAYYNKHFTPGDCAICLEPILNDLFVIYECKHAFHSQCLLKAYKHGVRNCPLCRKRLRVVMGCIIGMTSDVFVSEDVYRNLLGDEYMLWWGRYVPM